MGESTPEGAISPVQSVDSGLPKEKKSFFPKISLPNPVRLFKKSPTPEVAADITPAAVQATGFIPESPASTPVVESSPLNVASSDLSASPASVDTVAKNVEADLTAQMAATGVSSATEGSTSGMTPNPATVTQTEGVAPTASTPVGLNETTRDTATAMGVASGVFPGTGMSTSEIISQEPVAKKDAA